MIEAAITRCELCGSFAVDSGVRRPIIAPRNCSLYAPSDAARHEYPVRRQRAFQVGAVLDEHEASLHVESPHGKRSKIKSANVLLSSMAAASPISSSARMALAPDIDTDFLWEVCGESEFGFAELAADTTAARRPGRSGEHLIKLHSAPVYFHREGRAASRPLPADALKAAFAGVERKRRQEAQIAEWVRARAFHPAGAAARDPAAVALPARSQPQRNQGLRAGVRIATAFAAKLAEAMRRAAIQP